MGFREEIIKRVEKAKDLPTLPVVFLKLDKLIADKNSSANDIAGLMKDDIALTARVLRVANSAAFAGTTKIASVTQAVTRLGFRQLADMVKSLSMMGLFKGGAVVNAKQFWLHSLCVASIADVVPKSLGRMSQDQASLYTAGLLHDIGIFIMELYTGDMYQSVATMAVDTGKPLLQVEKKIMNIDHAEVGGLVLTRWGIPEIIVEAARRHHEQLSPSQGSLSVSDTIQIANLICNENGIPNGTGTIIPKMDQAEWAWLGIQADNLLILKEEVQKVATRCSSMLD